MSRNSRQDGLPIANFARSVARRQDPIALMLFTAIAVFSLAIVSLSFSHTVQTLAAKRFHLVGWSFAAWALFQPVPSMYNLQNRWDVDFTAEQPKGNDAKCVAPFHGFINHHIFNRILLERAALERCGLPAHVALESRYRDTTVTTNYTLIANPRSHGFTVVPNAK